MNAGVRWAYDAFLNRKYKAKHKEPIYTTLYNTGYKFAWLWELIDAYGNKCSAIAIWEENK
jgi:hypothetical protein